MENSENHGLYRYVSKILQSNTIMHFIFSKQMDAVPKGQIAIARNFGFVLNDDNHLTLLGPNENLRIPRSIYRIIKVAAAYEGYMALTDRGRIITAGEAHEFKKCREIEKCLVLKNLD